MALPAGNAGIDGLRPRVISALVLAPAALALAYAGGLYFDILALRPTHCKDLELKSLKTLFLLRLAVHMHWRSIQGQVRSFARYVRWG